METSYYIVMVGAAALKLCPRWAVDPTAERVLNARRMAIGMSPTVAG